MKNLICALFTLTVFASCKSKSANHGADSLNVLSPGHDSIAKFKTLLQGSWVTKDYTDDLIKTKSPIASRQYLSGEMALIIENSDKTPDSLKISCRTSIHEGGDTPVSFYFDTKSKSLITKPDAKSGFSELTYQITQHDTSLVMYYHDVKSHIIRPHYYVKAMGTDVSHLYETDAVQTITNHILFTGAYTLIDSTNKSSLVKLTNDGLVIGHPDLKNYFVMTDFIFGDDMGEGNNLDEILFNWYDKNLQKAKFIYKINKDTIKLFADTVTTGKLIPGKLTYRLVKKK